MAAARTSLMISYTSSARRGDHLPLRSFTCSYITFMLRRAGGGEGEEGRKGSGDGGRACFFFFFEISNHRRGLAGSRARFLLPGKRRGGHSRRGEGLLGVLVEVRDGDTRGELREERRTGWNGEASATDVSGGAKRTTKHVPNASREQKTRAPSCQAGAPRTAKSFMGPARAGSTRERRDAPVRSRGAWMSWMPPSRRRAHRARRW